jgi:molybdenum cofactor biosynthesis enzyme MoaA
MYDNIVLDSDFDKIMKNIEELYAMKQQSEVENIMLVSVVSALNYQDMPNFIKLAQKYGAYVTFIEYLKSSTEMGRMYNNMNKFCKILQEVHSLQYEKLQMYPVFYKSQPINCFQYLKYRFDDFYARVRCKN